MKFSIIIPVYNTAGELRACVSSVLSQDFHIKTLFVARR